MMQQLIKNDILVVVVQKVRLVSGLRVLTKWRKKSARNLLFTELYFSKLPFFVAVPVHHPKTHTYSFWDSLKVSKSVTGFGEEEAKSV